jgi:integrating conjugative element protein (TIGR03765 family)
MALVAAAWLAAGPASAEPAVLADRSPTRPVEDYGIPRLAAPAASALKAPAPLAPPGPAFPLRTPGLSPGPVEPRDANLPQLAGKPMFLVGSDAQSRAWLARNAARLAEIHAAGLVVQADGPEDVAALQSLAGGLPLSAVNAQTLALTLGISHYPVLVSTGRIEQ